MNKNINDINKKRFWEIDSLRGIAIIMMVIYHFLWDLNYFYGFDIVLHVGPWKLFQRICASIFLLLVGVSIVISKSELGFKKYLTSGFNVFKYAVLVTLVTYYAFRSNGVVLFGVLHLISLSIILAYLFRKLKFVNLFLGIVLVVVGKYLLGIFREDNWLMIFGIRSTEFVSVDYFPILPWFGVVLIGMFIGKVLYAGRSRNFKIVDLSSNVIIKGLCYLGRNALVIYVFHQLFLYLGFFFIGFII